MNCEFAQEQIATRWIAGLGEDARIELDEHLGGCAECREQSEALTVLWHGLGDLPAEEPSRNMGAHFRQMLEAYQLGAAGRTETARPKASFWSGLGSIWPRRPAGQLAMVALALVLGVSADRIYTQRGLDQEKIATLSSELGQMRELMTLSLLQQPSASERLRGVSFIEGTNSPDGEMTAALLDRLNHDSNVNVRLAAFDALKQAASHNETVRRGLQEAMLKQDSPLVQISLIDWAAEAGDRSSVGVLKSLRSESGLNPAVETRLASALNRLE